MEKCLRIVYNYEGAGGIKKILVDTHNLAWSGEIPCTGIYRCVHCGKAKWQLTKKRRTESNE